MIRAVFQHEDDNEIVEGIHELVSLLHTKVELRNDFFIDVKIECNCTN